MRKILYGVLLVFAVVLGLNGCATTTMSEENAQFQSESGLNMKTIILGLYSAGDVYRDSIVRKYMSAILANKLVFHLDSEQKEFARQTRDGDIIHIFVNEDYKSYDENEGPLLVVNATAALAFMQTPKKGQTEQSFFNYIELFAKDGLKIPNIQKARWYQSKTIRLGEDAVYLDS